MRDALGGGILGLCILTGIVLLLLGLRQEWPFLTASQRTTTGVIWGSFFAWVAVWVAWEVFTLVVTPDPNDHITAWWARLLLNRYVQFAFLAFAAAFAHLGSHLRFRRYALWPSRRQRRPDEEE